jgi:thiamine biosynthesis lipoprotein
MSGLAMATSGDYRNYYEVDGVRISHMIDPRTGRPITHRLASVSVIDDRCARADAWATALMILGPEEGYALAEEQDLPAFFLVHDGEAGFQELATPAFDRLTADNEKDRNP